MEAQEITRLGKAKDLVDKIKPLDGYYGLFSCPGSKDVSYTIDLTKETCTCPDQAIRGVICKHLYATKLSLGMAPDEKFVTPDNQLDPAQQEGLR